MLSDTVASGRSREDRLPGLLISKQERTRRCFCIRAGVEDDKPVASGGVHSLLGNRKVNRMTKKERGSALPIRHLSLSRILEMCEELEHEVLKRKGKAQYEATVSYLSTFQSQHGIGLQLWDMKQTRINNEEEWNSVIDQWDSSK